jgi:hypothetical protein
MPALLCDITLESCCCSDNYFSGVSSFESSEMRFYSAATASANCMTVLSLVVTRRDYFYEFAVIHSHTHSQK